MLRGAPVDVSTIILLVLAVIFTGVAYVKDPGLPWIGARNGLSLLWFILPRLIPALILTGMLQVLIPQEYVGRYLGREAGFRGIVIASVAGVLTPGGPMVSVPLVVALANS
ncbi:MAG: permease, partial [Nitrospiraceae bacterium]